MAQIDSELYIAIGEAYAAISDSLSTVQDNARIALDKVVNVGTTTYPDPSADPDAALEIELTLLAPLNAAYISAKTIESNIGTILDAVRTVNNFVIQQTPGTDTSDVKLETWIDSLDGEWASGTENAPAGWVLLCEAAGYDTVGAGVETDGWAVQA
jgi:hypothetical protein